MGNTLNVNNIAKEVLLILELLKEDNDDTIKKNQFSLCKDINWDLFLEYAMHHRVFPLLHLKMKILNTNLIPQFVLQFLAEQYKKNTFKMLQLTAEMENIGRIFTLKGIKVIFLKGPIIAHDLYGDVSARTSNDLDILVPIEYINIVDKILIEAGYEQIEFINSVFNEWKWREHHISFVHLQKKIKIEVHWRLHPGPGKEESFNCMWDRRRTSLVAKYPLCFLGKEDLFHFLVLHGARHGWSRIRWLNDIQQMCNHNLDWKLCVELFKSSNNIQLGGQVLILISELLNVKIDHDLKPLLYKNKARKLAENTVFFIERKVNLHTDSVPKM